MSARCLLVQRSYWEIDQRFRDGVTIMKQKPTTDTTTTTEPAQPAPGPTVGRLVRVIATRETGRIEKIAKNGKMRIRLTESQKLTHWLSDDEVNPVRQRARRQKESEMISEASEVPEVIIKTVREPDKINVTRISQLESQLAELNRDNASLRAKLRETKQQLKVSRRIKDIFAPELASTVAKTRKNLDKLTKAVRRQKKPMGAHLSLNLKCTGCKWLQSKGPGFAKSCEQLGKKATSPACESYDPHRILLNKDYEAIRKVGKTLRRAREKSDRDSQQIFYMTAYDMANAGRIPNAGDLIGLDLQFGTKVYVNLSNLVASNIQDSNYLNCWFEAYVHGVTPRNEGLILFTKFGDRYIHTIKVLREGSILSKKQFDQLRRRLIKAGRIDAPLKVIQTNFPSLARSKSQTPRANKPIAAIGKVIENQLSTTQKEKLAVVELWQKKKASKLKAKKTTA